MDGQSHLLLIREEAGPPDAQVREKNRKRVFFRPPFFLYFLSSSTFPSFLLLICFSITSHPPLLLLPLIFSSFTPSIISPVLS